MVWKRDLTTLICWFTVQGELHKETTDRPRFLPFKLLSQWLDFTNH